MAESTRIADLPENITMKPVYSQDSANSGGYVAQPPPQNMNMSQPNFSLDKGAGMPPTNYVQMNVHPNPYGNGPPQGGIGLPQQTHVTKPSNNPYISQTEQPPHMAHLPQHQLPSRDIPHDTTSYYQDPEINANYIPSSKNASDFVKEYEETYRQKELNIKTREKAVRSIDDVFVEFRTTIIVGLLFLLFQSPAFHNSVLKHFSALNVYNADGNLNVNGLLLKSLAFGGAFYLIEKLGEYVR